MDYPISTWVVRHLNSALICASSKLRLHIIWSFKNIKCNFEICNLWLHKFDLNIRLALDVPKLVSIFNSPLHIYITQIFDESMPPKLGL